jgi:sodium-dependent dicarboxylate transporter 2/3/5
MNRRKIAVVVGPLLGLLVGVLLRRAGYQPPLCWTAGVTTWVALWWVLEPIPIPATSLIPFALFPLGGVLTHSQVAKAYGHTLILLLLAGFVLSCAMERSGAHRRLALTLVRIVGGTSGRRIVFGFMLAAAALSMWISNSATALMLLPVAMAILEQAEDRKTLAVPLLLGLAYGANIGGIGTPVGTPPNVIFMALYRQITGIEWTFLQWMVIGVPVVVIFLPVAWLWITRGLHSTQRLVIPHPGPWRPEERRVLILFAVAALLWIFRTEPLGGWNGLVERMWDYDPTEQGSLVGDSTVALLMVLVMFLVPDGRGGHLLDWEAAKRLPWGLLLLFGGGLAIGMAFQESKLSEEIGHLLSRVVVWNLLVIIAVVCLTVTFLTELTSNTATTNILLPILAGACQPGEGQWLVPPEVLMVPAAISASCAFMLPVATVPNAIVFGTDYISTDRMVREGLVLNLLGAVIITLVCFYGLAGGATP